MAKKAIFMIGWEYPPHNSGGLGEACAGITEALSDLGSRIYFTLPYLATQSVEHMQMLGCYNPDWDTPHDTPPFQAYTSAGFPQRRIDGDLLSALPESELEFRVGEYAQFVSQVAAKKKDEIGVIHAHDWMAFPAAMELKRKLQVPFVAHVHSTEFDRIPSGFGSKFINQTEYEGMRQADTIIAVSHYTKQVLIDKYNVDPAKIEVVHNGINTLEQSNIDFVNFAPDRPVVVFMGRLTMQKGAEYFIELAQSILQKVPQALFIVAGQGDSYQSLLFKTAGNHLSTSVLFSGFLRGREREMLLDRANVFVMPSLSEPFGLVALEAAQRSTPVIISSNSGVQEVLKGSIVADFWDIEKMSQSIEALLADSGYSDRVVADQHASLRSVTWKNTAQKIRGLYQRLVGRK